VPPVPPVQPVPPALHRKHGLRGALFTVLVVVAIFVGAAVIAFVFAASGQPQAIAVGLMLALLPVGPLVACYLWLDRYEPEPVPLLVTAFLWGALVATAAALLVQTVDQAVNGSSDVWSAVVTAPLTEEAGKGVFVLLLLWARRHVIDGVLDGLVYAGLVGVGFAFTENILYFAGAFNGGTDLGPGGLGSATSLFVLRGVFSPFAHPLFTSAIGIGVGLMVSTRHRGVRVVAPLVGYAVAVGLHAAWNASAFLYDGQFFLLTYLFAMVPGFLVLVGLAIWFRVREGAMLTRALDDLARRGYLPPPEVPWLVRLPARRTARRNAALRGGPAAEALMRDYQQQAIELAALHNRVMRGTAPSDHPHRGAHMVQRLAALRAHLMLPRHAAHSLPRHRQDWS
jgi:RsiW-degrading membrane proteinase PrsW (M82 family)